MSSEAPQKYGSPPWNAANREPLEHHDTMSDLERTVWQCRFDIGQMRTYSAREERIARRCGIELEKAHNHIIELIRIAEQDKRIAEARR